MKEDMIWKKQIDRPSLRFVSKRSIIEKVKQAKRTLVALVLQCRDVKSGLGKGTTSKEYRAFVP